MHALVTKKISEFDRGEVKLNGQFWTSRSEDGSTIEEGTKCEVVRIEGVQAIVRMLKDKQESDTQVSDNNE
jgi:membrane protein implicated in regulation of membrane protease activity